MWKASTTYLGLLASSEGDIRTGWGKDLVQRTNSYGYRTVFWDGRKYLVHRVVCDAFHGPPHPWQTLVLHRGDRTDNRPGNVYWATAQERANQRGRSVQRLSDGRVWRSAREAGAELEIDVTTISAAARKKDGWTYVDHDNLFPEPRGMTVAEL